MTASPKRRRNRTLAAAVSGVLVLGAAPVLGVTGYHVLLDSKEGTAAKTLDTIGFPSTPTAMLAVVDDQQLVTAMAVLVMAPPASGDPSGLGKGGTLVSFPTNATTSQTAEEQQVPLADSVITKGVEATTDDVVSLARVSIGSAAVLDQAGLAQVLATVPPATVSLPADVVDAAADGSVTTVLPAGQQTLDPSQLASGLVAADPSQKESTRLPNVRAMWDGIAAAVGTGIDPGSVQPFGPEGPADFNDFMKHFLAGPIQVYNDLTTVPIVGETNPNNADVGRLDVPTVVMLMASLAPSAVITPKPTANFRIENGLTQTDIDAAGLVGVTPTDVTLDVVQHLLFAEGNVVSVANEVYTLPSKAVPDVTTLIADSELVSSELDVFSKQLGEVTSEEPKFQFPLVNVVVVVGRSYLANMAAGRADAADPSASTVDSSVDTPATDTPGTAGEASATSTVSSG